ncbi:hypothetical protein LINPERHAP1_LOCUS2800 [Linum perenne]
MSFSKTQNSTAKPKTLPPNPKLYRQTLLLRIAVNPVSSPPPPPAASTSSSSSPQNSGLQSGGLARVNSSSVDQLKIRSGELNVIARGASSVAAAAAGTSSSSLSSLLPQKSSLAGFLTNLVSESDLLVLLRRPSFTEIHIYPNTSVVQVVQQLLPICVTSACGVDGGGGRHGCRLSCFYSGRASERLIESEEMKR